MPQAKIPVLREHKPKMKTSRKIVLILILLFIVLFAVLFFRSSLSRITEIDFKGSLFTSEAELLKQSALHVGGQFFGTSTGEVEERLKEIKTIQSVHVDKQFPGIISINIKEYDTVAYEVGTDGSLLAILSNGTSVGVSNSGIAVEKPVLTSWKADDPYKAELCKILSDIPGEWTADISEIIPDPSPSFPDRIKMYTRSQFEVLTSVSLLAEKISYLNQVLETEEPGLVSMFEADTYVPFQPEEEGGAVENDTTQ
ncbi:FtsQ-type POTRA domain-containing protein [Paenibacillus sp. P96]|uniref:Cell division protein DivIB n=1 Tax=Paenibacillus zeirhizosphaerae TaxID=2987519 RepID=A0ABT9FQB3_9BACL|nr:FtsQ-type POTRA domain-containing protein [Paenibacillus sp. P96]MDP4096931.1 FtsQ-type POTRA domain-containing protein [Paenibacillus sp. P96]